MIKIRCYSNHPELFILLGRSYKMDKKQKYFEIDLKPSNNLEFGFKSQKELERCHKRNYKLEDKNKILICKFNDPNYKIKNMKNIIQKYTEFDNSEVLKFLNYSYYYIRTFNEKKYYCVITEKAKLVSHKIGCYYNHKKRVCYICGAFAEYNYKPTGYGLYCDTHKLTGMCLVGNYFCWNAGCEKEGDFRKSNTSEVYCSNHKTLEMKLFQKKKCNFIKCEKKSYYGFIKGVSLFCADHKEDGMYNIKAKICKTHMCDTQVSKKYEGYCFRCYVHLFPEKPNARNYKTKEFAVVEFIKIKFPDLNWIHDKSSGASGRRPDLLCDLGGQIIIIEVDENAHNNEKYCSCENKRLMQISKDFNHKPIIFIRFNPDKYNFVPSCWKLTKTGLQAIVNKNKWEARLNTLAETVNYWIINKTDKTVEEIFLFYNGFK